MNINSKRRKQRITALTLVATMMLSGCNGGTGRFEYTENENNELVAVDGSYIANTNIDNCYVVEVYNTLKKENEIYIARVTSYRKSRELYYDYYDVFTNLKIVSTSPFEESLLNYVNATKLEYYIVALGMAQLKYSYDDMKNIYESIKENYVFESDDSLRKILTNNNRI